MIRKLSVASAILSCGLLACTVLAAEPVAADQGAAHVVTESPTAVPARPAPQRLRPERTTAADRPGFSRLTFAFPYPTGFTMTRTGDDVALLFRTRAMIGTSVSLPHNVTGESGGVGRADIHLAPGRLIRTATVGATVVLDVFDTDQAAPAPAAPDPSTPNSGTVAQKPAPSSMSPPPGPLTLPAPGRDSQVAAQPAAPAGTAPVEPVQSTPLPPAGTAPSAGNAGPGIQAASDADATDDLPPDAPTGGPVALAIMRAALPAGSPGAAIIVPFDRGTGLAVFRRGALAIAVFDQRRPIDVAPLRADPIFTGAGVQLLSAATVLRFAMAPGAELRAARVAQGWRLWVGLAPKPLRAVEVTIADHNLVLSATAPGKVIVVPDPETGSNLLVGTQTADGQGMAVTRHSPEFSLLATWQGVAVEPLSDRLELHVGASGFVLSAGGSALGLALPPNTASTVAMADAASLTRRFDFPAGPKPTLLTRLQSEIAGAAAQPQLARLKLRHEAAQTMIALGLDAEAEALLQLAAQDDPRAAADPDIGGLTAVAALLAGRLAEGAGIADPALGTSDEVTLWRAVRGALTQEGDPAAAAQFASTLPLVVAYPEAMQARLLPLVAETMALGGQPEAAAGLLARHPDDPSLALARAMLLQAKGDNAGALAAYDTLTRGADPLVRARAGLRAVELRLASGEIGPGDAAQAEERMFYGWRGDEREKSLRLRSAALRADAGQWRQSLTSLRESDALFGADDPRFKTALHETFGRLLADGRADQMTPLDLVEVMRENVDLLPGGPAGEAMVVRLADRLSTLDLPRLADPVLEGLLHTATSAGARGEFGAVLAKLRLGEKDSAGALAALAASTSDGLSAPLVEQRTLLAAHATELAGNAPDALSLLAPLTSTAAMEYRATILEHLPDWPAAEAAMVSYVAAVVPAAGPLTPAQTQSVLRLTGDAVQAGDEPGLSGLRKSYGSRITDPAAVEMFRTLTEDPVRGLGDLPRSGREAAAARTLPQALAAIGKGGPVGAAPPAARP